MSLSRRFVALRHLDDSYRRGLVSGLSPTRYGNKASKRKMIEKECQLEVAFIVRVNVDCALACFL